VLARRLAAQLLSGRQARDAVSVVERLLAVQAQDGRGARLAIRARSRGLLAGHVDRALSEDRTLLITWLCRGTLHLVSREDYPWLHGLTAPAQLAGNARRLSQTGVSQAAAETAVEIVERSLESEGPLTREQVKQRLDAAGIVTKGQALIHLLMLASLRGVAIRGPMVGGQHAYALVRDWLGPSAGFDRDRALAELARRYLAGHGPAEDRDLAKWAGLPLRDARAGLQSISAQIVQDEHGLVALRRPAPSERPARTRLLGAFDPVLHGWQSRAQVLGRHERAIVQGGMFRPFVMVRGQAVGTWGLPGGRVVLTELEHLTAADRADLAADAADVTRFLALPQPAD
jgi:hypothetical protein